MCSRGSPRAALYALGIMTLELMLDTGAQAGGGRADQGGPAGDDRDRYRRHNWRQSPLVMDSAHSYEKISIFRDYVEAFVRASGNAFNRGYIDACAGDTENVLKVTGERFPGSAEIALAVQPPFTHVALFELPQKAKRLRTLQTQYGGGREVRVYEGNCNELMIAALRRLPVKAPTFAFIDPDGMEVEWRTIRLLADHKRQYAESQKKTKVEMWILFSTGGMGRMLGSNEASAKAANLPEKVARLYGGWGPWERIWRARLTGELDPGEARLAYLLLYMDRLEELGYRYLLLARYIRREVSYM